MDTLTEVRQYLSTISHIHSGGCGISALSMFRWCKNHNILIEIVCLEDDKKLVESNLKKLSKGITKNLFVPEHCGIKLGEKIIDCFPGNDNKISYFEGSYLVTESEMVDIINTGNAWNDSFCRCKKCLKDIEINLEIDLSDIKEL